MPGQKKRIRIRTIVLLMLKCPPMGFAWKAIDTTKKKSKPSNATAKITLDNNLDNIKFTLANKYYNVIAVIASNNVPATKTNLIKKLAKRVNNAVYAKVIIDHLNCEESRARFKMSLKRALFAVGNLLNSVT